MPTVSHHGRTTAYRVTDDGGAGDPLLFIHGSGVDGGLWLEQHPLAVRRPVITLDLSGHGESEDVAAAPGGETLSAYASDVIAVAREVDTRLLVGASLGAATAMTIALERSFSPGALVLVGAGAKLSVLSDLLAWLADDYEQAVEFLHRPDVLFHDTEVAPVERSKRTMHETGRTVTRRDFETCHQFDVRDRLDEIEMPTLALVGEYDRLTPRWYHEYLTDNLPDCRLGVVKDAAHLAMVEQPGPFNDALREFLQTVDV
jgi:pimeloyl-ACP methyl ester carboxylesterase